MTACVLPILHDVRSSYRNTGSLYVEGFFCETKSGVETWLIFFGNKQLNNDYETEQR